MSCIRHRTQRGCERFRVYVCVCVCVVDAFAKDQFPVIVWTLRPPYLSSAFTRRMLTSPRRVFILLLFLLLLLFFGHPHSLFFPRPLFYSCRRESAAIATIHEILSIFSSTFSPAPSQITSSAPLTKPFILLTEKRRTSRSNRI